MSITFKPSFFGNSKTVLIFGFLAIFLSRTGIAFSNGIPANTEALTKNAEQTLNVLKEAYEREDLEGFFRRVSDNAAFDVSNLKFSVSERFSDFSGLQLVFFVDNTLVEKNKVLMELHWQRRGVNSQTGQVETNEGQAHLTFEVKKETKLLNIQKESPF